MKKSYILDTNVLLQSPYAIYAFGDNDVIVPEAVLEELDRFKKEASENGANARQTARIMDKLRENGDITRGVELPGGGLFRIELNFHDVELPEGWLPTKADNRILKVCKGLLTRNEKAILVTKDIFLRIKGDIIGITVQDFHNEQVVIADSQYRGRVRLYATAKKLDEFYKKGSLNPRYLYSINEETGEKQDVQLIINQFVTLLATDNGKQSALGRFDGKQLVPLKYLEERPFGVRARNVGQRFIQEALMMSSDEIPLVIIKGAAGTAKTFFSLAVGLHKVLNQKDSQYRKILVLRPNVKFDEDIGYLPGSETDKLAPFLRAVIDNLETLVDSDDGERYKNENELKDKVDELFTRNIITTEAIAYIRGRSIQKNWVVIDEAQNLTPKQVKGIVTRAGQGTKLILIGDPDQIDHPYLDSRTNGLSFASERMKGSPYCCQLSMDDEECERSPLAYDSAARMTTCQKRLLQTIYREFIFLSNGNTILKANEVININTFSHRAIGKILYNYLKEKHGVTLDKKSFLWGNIAPDFEPAFFDHPHYIKYSLGYIEKETEALAGSELKSLIIGKAYSKKLGIICHYYADYFCYAHSIYFNNNLRSHMKYESDLHKFLVEQKEFIGAIDLIPVIELSTNVKIINAQISKYQAEYLRGGPDFSKDILYTLRVAAGAILSLINCSCILNSSYRTSSHASSHGLAVINTAL